MRGAGGDSDVAPADALVTVREFLDRVGDRRPTAEEIREIAPALEKLYERLVKLRSLAPAYRRVDLSDRIWELMARIGKKKLPPSRGSLGRAASFL